MEMATLSWRLANKEVTLQSIARRARLSTTPTYADILVGRPAQQVPPRSAAPQGTPHLTATYQNRPLKPPTNHYDEAQIEEGWTTVTRKRKVRNLISERKPSVKLNKYTAALRAEGRCYKCLDRGHTQFQCRNGTRCHKCKGIGHIARICVEKEKGNISAPTAQPKQQTIHLKETSTTSIEQPENLEMDYENWENIPMLSPTLIQNRAPELQVFMPPNNDIQSPNTKLHRCAIVLLGPRAATVNQLHSRIADTMATTFECHPDDFKVNTLHPSVGDLIIEFPSNVLRNLAVHVGVFTIARGVEIQLRAWTTNLNMVRDPTTHRARIVLDGVPMHYWNFSQINHLISGFGYADCMTPVITNGNFETLRVMISCYDPSTIPPTLSLHKDPGSTTVYVHIEGWLHKSPPPPPPPNSDDDDGQGGSHFGPERGRHHHRMPATPTAGGYGRRPERQCPVRMTTGGSSTGYQRETGENRNRAPKAALDAVSTPKATVLCQTWGNGQMGPQQRTNVTPVLSFTKVGNFWLGLTKQKN